MKKIQIKLKRTDFTKIEGKIKIPKEEIEAILQKE